MTAARKNFWSLVVLAAAVLVAKRGPLLTPPEPLIAGPGLSVLVLEETADRLVPGRLRPGQLQVLTGQAWRAAVRAAGGEFRQFDVTEPPARAAPKWRDACARPHATLPWAMVSAGTAGWEGPLPDDEQAFVDVIASIAQQAAPRQ